MADMAHVYLIVMEQVLVADDLEAMVLEIDPTAAVLRSSTIAEAPSRLAGVGRVTAALVEAGPAEFRASDLAGTPALRGAAVVLSGEDAEADGEAGEWVCLTRPFGPDQVRVALERAMERAAGV